MRIYSRICARRVAVIWENAVNEGKMRKDFETWVRSTKRTENQLRRMSGGEYEVMATQWEWQAWQAAAPAWQPISTAPRDGTVVLARIPDQDVQQAVMWSAKENCWVIQWDHWKLDGFDTPTHWMPLPPAPEEKT